MRPAAGIPAAVRRRTHSGRSHSARRTTASPSGRCPSPRRGACADNGSTGSRRYADRRLIEGKNVAVVIPAYEEETLLPATLDGIPELVDRIYVVDDASTDGTVARARTAAE